MKKILMAMIAAAGAFLLSAEMPRSEWHAKVGDCAQDPNMLKETISQLSSADKTAFLAEVNAAIDKMPGSAESKAAKFLAANRAAVAGAGPADRADVLAEVYATVPPEVLPVINEEFSKNEFARPDTMDIDDFTNIVAQAMTKIAQRCSSAESGSVRSAFAGVMLINASGLVNGATSAELSAAIDAAKQAGDGTSAGAGGGATAAGATGGAATAAGTTGGGTTGAGADTPLAAVIATVVSSLPSEVRSDAIGSRIPSALGPEGTASYDPMMAASQAGDEPNAQVVLNLAPSQKVDSMLADLQSGKTDPGESIRSGIGIPGASDAASSDQQGDATSTVPRDRVADPESVYYKGKNRSKETPVTPPEPDPYKWQNL